MADIKLELTCKQRTLSGKLRISKNFWLFIPFVCLIFLIYQMCHDLYRVSDELIVVGITFHFLVRLLLISFFQAAAAILMYFLLRNRISFINKHKYCVILTFSTAVFLLQSHAFLAECATPEDLIALSLGQFVSFLVCSVVGFSAYAMFHKYLKSHYAFH